MTRKTYKVKENDIIEKCPKCGNNTEFKCCADQVGEDVCDVWVECKCGFDPTSGHTGYRVEDTWGSVGWEDFQCAVRHSWNEAINKYYSTPSTP